MELMKGVDVVNMAKAISEKIEQQRAKEKDSDTKLIEFEKDNVIEGVIG